YTTLDYDEDKENIPPLPDSRRLDTLLASHRALIDELCGIRILLPLNRYCPSCIDKHPEQRLKAYNDTTYTDGIRLRCNRCKGEWSVRHGSIFCQSALPLITLLRLI